MIVVDSMIQVYATTPTSSTDLVFAVAQKDSEWCAPLLWRSEYRSAMLGLIRADQITGGAALRAFERAEGLVKTREYDVRTGDVIALGPGNRISAYDLEFVALAQELGVRLVTFDREVLTAFPGVAVHPNDFVAG